LTSSALTLAAPLDQRLSGPSGSPPPIWLDLILHEMIAANVMILHAG
jgi:hypothetical protein